MQNTWFSRLNQVTCKSPGQATRHLRRNFWKICLSVFRDWKFHPWRICKGSYEIFFVTFATGAFTRELVARNLKWKFSKCFSRLGQWPASELQKPTVWSRDWTDLRPSRQNKATLFLKNLTFFVKIKYFPKTTETLKNLFVFDQQKLSMWNTYNQVQSQKWIWHSLNIDMYDVCGYQ